METENDLKSVLRELFETQSLAVLATSAGGQPYSSLVAFAHTPDLRQLVFATGRATRKFTNLTGEARVSLLVDNRQNQLSDFRDAIAVTATGTSREAAGGEKDRLAGIHLARHPYLAKFIAGPANALIAVTVDTYYLVRRFQDVVELHLGD